MTFVILNYVSVSFEQSAVVSEQAKDERGMSVAVDLHFPPNAQRAQCTRA